MQPYELKTIWSLYEDAEEMLDTLNEESLDEGRLYDAKENMKYSMNRLWHNIIKRELMRHNVQSINEL